MLQKRVRTFTAQDKISHAEDKITPKKCKRRNSKKDDNNDSDTKTLEENGIYFFNGEVDNGTVGDAIRFILEANLDLNCQWEYITFLINSPGGYVTDGFALIDVIHGSRIPIRTVGIGLIASMGLQILLAGEKGTRTLTPNTMILSHQYAGMSLGKEHELVAAKNEIEQMSEIIMRHYKRSTGMTEKNIRKHLLPPSDVWMTAQTAKELGICDVVKDIKPKQIAPKKK